MTSVHRQVGALGEEDLPLQITPPAYTFTKLAETRVNMLAKATGDARRRARAIAREEGSGIGAITRADNFTFQITESNSTRVSNAGSNNTSTVE